MLHNPYFWLGELGLVLTFVSCLTLMYRLRHQHWLTTIVPIWAVLIFTLCMLVRPVIINIDHTIPPLPYLYRFAVGVLMASRTWHYLRGEGKTTDAKELTMAHRILAWASIVGTLALILIGLKLKR
ncbi:hypothetical protein [Spirosoma fluminis]